jgi:hypothetical protein
MTEPASWTDLVNESVHTSDDHDIGYIEALNRHFVVVKRGLVNIHRYHIPMSRAEGWDGKVVWLKVPEDHVKSAYERDAAPDPYYYHYSNAPVADDNLRQHLMIVPKISPKYEEEPFVIAHRRHEEPSVLRCDLCNATFRTEEERSDHIGSH